MPDHSTRRRPRATVTSVLGELLLTAGVLVGLFVVWQMWVGDVIIGAQLNERGAALSQRWAADAGDSAAADLPPQEPPTMEHPDDGEVFANMLVPRFGADYNVNIAGGTSRARTLDPIGIGLYTQSKMPGELGNLSLAGHRTTWGRPFNMLDRLRVGDAIVIETADGWFTYRFRNLEYVKPTQVDILLDVPRMPQQQGGDRLITLTACSPLHSLAERIVAYGVFEGFQPRAAGPPPSLAPVDEVATPRAAAAHPEGAL